MDCKLRIYYNYVNGRNVDQRWNTHVEVMRVWSNGDYKSGFLKGDLESLRRGLRLRYKELTFFELLRNEIVPTVST
jgi:hypothetical protein